MQTRGKKHKAFTLIELLVVISIISLLTTILLPSLSHAKRLAKQVSCMANLKGIGLGWRMYMDDHENAVPVANSLPIDADDPESYTRAMAKYVEGDDHWKCPGDDTEAFKTKGTSYEYYIGYVVYSYKDADALLQEIVFKLRRFLDDNADQLPVIADADMFHPTRKHPDNKNKVFHDGHVEDGPLNEEQLEDFDPDDVPEIPDGA